MTDGDAGPRHDRFADPWSLRPAVTADLDDLHRIALDRPSEFGWCFTQRTPPLETFHDLLRRRSQSQAVAVRDADVVLVVCYDLSYRHRTAWLAAHTLGGTVEADGIAEVLRDFARRLEGLLDLRAVYTRADEPAFEGLSGLGAVVVGELTEYRFRDGARRSEFLVELTRRDESHRRAPAVVREPVAVPALEAALDSEIVELEPLRREADAAFVYEVYSSDESGLFLRYGGLPPAPTMFVSDVLDTAFDQMIARLTSADGRPVGYARCDDVDLVAGHGVLSFALAPQYQRLGLILLLGAKYIDHLFDRWSFNKLYVHLPDFTAGRFPDLGLARMEVEARLAGYLYHDHRVWDMVIASISRESWEAHREVGPLVRSG